MTSMVPIPYHSLSLPFLSSYPSLSTFYPQYPISTLPTTPYTSISATHTLLSIHQMATTTLPSISIIIPTLISTTSIAILSLPSIYLIYLFSTMYRITTISNYPTISTTHVNCIHISLFYPSTLTFLYSYSPSPYFYPLFPILTILSSYSIPPHPPSNFHP